MPLFDALLTFSHTYCVGICGALVPLMLLSTLASLLCVYYGRRGWPLTSSRAVAGLAIILMVIHVGTWFWVGVVTPITFILLSLASLCLAVNGGLAWYFGEFGSAPARV